MWEFDIESFKLNTAYQNILQALMVVKQEGLHHVHFSGYYIIEQKLNYTLQPLQPLNVCSVLIFVMWNAKFDDSRTKMRQDIDHKFK